MIISSRKMMRKIQKWDCCDTCSLIFLSYWKYAWWKCVGQCNFLCYTQIIWLFLAKFNQVWIQTEFRPEFRSEFRFIENIVKCQFSCRVTKVACTSWFPCSGHHLLMKNRKNIISLKEIIFFAQFLKRSEFRLRKISVSQTI